MYRRPWDIVAESDPRLFQLLNDELKRQEMGIELIASENFASPSVIAAAANPCTNKYAEGLPDSRYYGGCHIVDEIEKLAITRATSLFNCLYANVQPHSGAQANAAVFLALLKAGDRILGLKLTDGGHLTHGSKVNFSGQLYDAHSYRLHAETDQIDFDDVRKKAHELKPKLIIAGFSAYPRMIDFEAFRAICDEVGAMLLVDMSHIAGLVATGLHPSPFPHAHVVTTTTHKTLRGPRGGMILWNDDALSKSLNKGVFPGIQGGPLEHIIAAKALALQEAAHPSFKVYQSNVKENAVFLAKSLKNEGFDIVTDGTDTHLVLVNLAAKNISGKDLEKALEQAGMTTNKNTVPRDALGPFVTSGIRLGTPAVTTRGMQKQEMQQIAFWIKQVCQAPLDANLKSRIKREVAELCKKYPIYPDWAH
jgi:glycine hydroxymethyltransferase